MFIKSLFISLINSRGYLDCIVVKKCKLHASISMNSRDQIEFVIYAQY